MAVAIHLRFLTGRAHLHPWHAAPNEGRVEWPPSPWRLLRALVAVAGRGLTTLPRPDHEGVIQDDWFAPPTTSRRHSPRSRPGNVDDSLTWQPDILPVGTLAALLHRLSAPPVVWLPRTGIGHSRHFFATRSGPRSGRWGETTGSPTFDTFAGVDPEEPVVFEWPDLSPEPELEAQLGRLVRSLPYFGRSESLCDAELVAEAFRPVSPHWPCAAVEHDEAFAQHFKDLGLREYRDYTVEKRLGWDRDQCGFLRERFRAPTSAPPELLLRALLQSSAESMTHGDRPWGTRWLRYAVPREVFRLPTPRLTIGRGEPMEAELRPQPNLQVIRYALNTATVHRAALPSVAATLTVAQRCRAAVLAIFGRQNDGRCSPQLSGKRFRDESRRYQLFAESDGDQVVKFDRDNGGHSAHAYWWPVDEDGDGFLDHLIVLCEHGFSARDEAALRALTRVQQHGARPDLLLTPLFAGSWADCSGAFFRPDMSQDFVSATPYFCPIHLGRRSGKPRSLRDQVRRSLVEIDIPVADQIDEIVFDYDPQSLGRVEGLEPRQQFMAHVRDSLRDPAGEVIVERGGFLRAWLDAPLPVRATTIDPARYPGACLRDPDAPNPLGLARGLFVAHGQRFVQALAFHRARTAEARARGRGVMLRVRFSGFRPSRPFAIGQFCHFGLGLFIPVVEQVNQRSWLNTPALDHDPTLAEIVRRLVAAYQPERIYLFGSKARGEEAPDSDYDLLVIVPDDAPPERRDAALAYRALRGTGIGADVIPWTRSRFEARKHVVTSLPATVLREGKLIYAA